MLIETIPAALHEQRLDRVVALIADISRANTATPIELGGVTLDGVEAASYTHLTLPPNTELVCSVDAVSIKNNILFLSISATPNLSTHTIYFYTLSHFI